LEARSLVAAGEAEDFAGRSPRARAENQTSPRNRPGRGTRRLDSSGRRFSFPRSGLEEGQLDVGEEGGEEAPGRRVRRPPSPPARRRAPLPRGRRRGHCRRRTNRGRYAATGSSRRDPGIRPQAGDAAPESGRREGREPGGEPASSSNGVEAREGKLVRAGRRSLDQDPGAAETPPLGPRPLVPVAQRAQRRRFGMRGPGCRPRRFEGAQRRELEVFPTPAPGSRYLSEITSPCSVN